MEEVFGGCQVCGKRMLTDGNPLTYRTCDECKTKRRREYSRQTSARLKAERHAFKEDMGVPRCEHCGKPIKGAKRLAWDRPSDPPQWARKFCGNTCRQAAFRAR